MSFKLKHVVLVNLMLFSEVIVPKIRAQELKTKEWASPSTQIKFLKIPAGCFQIGPNQGFKFQAPVHVEDWFSKDYFKTSPTQNPKGPPTSRFKVKREVRRGKFDKSHQITYWLLYPCKQEKLY